MSRPLQLLDLTAPSPEENLALDEALLDMAEEGYNGEIFRFWEPARYFVVLGSSSRVAEEVDLEACALEGVPVLRRRSGGGTVLQGPGCLNYSLILSLHTTGPCATLSGTNAFVMGRHREALAALTRQTVTVRGSTDLAIGDMKFSGNAQRRRLRALLFHGTFLCGFMISRIEKFLPSPPKQPAYRLNRSHAQFLMNLDTDPAPVKAALIAAWNAAESFPEVPCGRIDALVRERYSRREWTFRQ